MAAVGTAAGLAALALGTKAAWGEFAEAEKVAAQTEAVLKSTGAAARVTAKHVDELAAAISDYSGIDDEAVQAGENMLLTFTQIQSRLGKNNDIFDQATKATADLSVAMGIDMPKAALQVGKALNDPARGYARLQRIGVAFTKGQVESIKALSAAGKTAEAQKVILAELTTEFGGSAKAAGQTLPGQLKILRENMLNFGAGILRFFIPTLSQALGPLKQLVGFIGQVARAPSLEVAIEIAAGGLRDIGVRIKTQIQSAIAGTQWGPIGTQLGQAIGSAIMFTDAALGRAMSSLLVWVNTHAQEFAEMGALIGVRIVTTLTDPAFWADHLDLLAILISLRFGGSLLRVFGRLGGRAATALLGSIGRALAPAGAVVSAAFARVPSMIATPFVLGGRLAWQAITFVVTTLKEDLRAVLGKVPGWIKAAFNLGAILAVVGAVQWLTRELRTLIGALRGIDWPSPPGWLTRGLKGASPIPFFKRAGGGFVPTLPGAQAGVDSVPALLTPGEMVLNRQQQEALGGPAFLSGLLGFQRFATGGPVKKKKPTRAEIAKAKAERRSRRRERLAGQAGGRVARSERAETVAERRAGRKQRRRERSGGELTPGEIDAQIKDIRGHIGNLKQHRTGLLADAARAQRAGFPGLARELRQQAQDVSSEIADLQEDIADLQARKREALAARAAPTGELPPEIEEELLLAEDTESPEDDLAALGKAEAFWKEQLAKAKTAEQRVPILRELRAIRDRRADLTGAKEPDVSADTQAQLVQANQRLSATQRALQLQNAAIGAGVFGPTVILQSLVAPTDAMARHAGQVVAAAFGEQGHRPATTVPLGV